MGLVSYKFKIFSYICNAVRGAGHLCSAEIIPYEPDMYNDSAGKRYGIHCFIGLNWAVFSGLYNICKAMKTTISSDVLSAAVTALRTESPLVHNITNYVVMNNSANALLAVGASPVMAHWVSEMEEMTAIAGALVINIGTLDDKWIEGMLAAGKAAKRRGIPVILDPVGVGATSQRTEAAMRIIEECNPAIIRGNASEVMALVDASVKSKGVDSSASSDDAVEYAKRLSADTGAVVVISGETDYITDGTDVYTVEGGSPVMTAVTGMGCTATAIVGACAAVVADRMVAATAAMALMSLAGERAAAYSRGNGSMQMNFLDELYKICHE